MLKLQEILESGETYQIFPVWSHKDSYYVTIAQNPDKLEVNQYTCIVHDDQQVLELKKRKARTLYLPYHSIRYIEVSPASDVTKQLFG